MDTITHLSTSSRASISILRKKRKYFKCTFFLKVDIVDKRARSLDSSALLDGNVIKKLVLAVYFQLVSVDSFANFTYVKKGKSQSTLILQMSFVSTIYAWRKFHNTTRKYTPSLSFYTAHTLF